MYARLARRWALVGSVLLPTVLAGAGCGRPSKLVLHQPFAPRPSQRQLGLSGRWSFSSANGQRRKCVLAFPRPCDQDGPRDFLVYLSFPAGAELTTVNPSHPAAARGFLVQKVGLLKGKVVFTSGTLRWRKVFLGGDRRCLDLDLRSEDGTRVIGTAFVEAAPTEVRDFERRYAADVSLLTSATSQPALRSRQSAPRPPASP
jgi:hypothetical protein